MSRTIWNRIAATSAGAAGVTFTLPSLAAGVAPGETSSREIEVSAEFASAAAQVPAGTRTDYIYT